MRSSTVRLGYTCGVLSALAGIITLVAGSIAYGFAVDQLFLYGSQTVFGILAVCFTVMLRLHRAPRPWLRPLLWAGYLGSVAQVFLGIAFLYAAFMMSSFDLLQPLMLVDAIATIGCAAVLLLTTERLDSATRGRPSRMSR